MRAASRRRVGQQVTGRILRRDEGTPGAAKQVLAAENLPIHEIHSAARDLLWVESRFSLSKSK